MALFWFVVIVVAVVSLVRLSGWKRLFAALALVIFCICFGIAAGFLYGFPWT